MLDARLRHAGSKLPEIDLEDGRIIRVPYEVLDASRAQHLDRVRVSISGAGEVTQMVPFASLTEAIAVLSRAGVLETDKDSLGAQDDEPWPSAIFDQAWEAPGDAVFRCDEHYLDAKQVEDWLRRSGVSEVSITPGPSRHDEPTIVIDIGQGPREPVRPAAFDTYHEVAAILVTVGAPFRWYELPSLDARSLFLRFDRATADALGVGVFEA